MYNPGTRKKKLKMESQYNLVVHNSVRAQF